MLLGVRFSAGFQSINASSQAAVRSIKLSREMEECAVWHASNQVLNMHGFCVSHAAQSFLGPPKEVSNAVEHNEQESTQHVSFVLLRKSFHAPGVTHELAPRTLHLSFQRLCVCQTANTSTILPTPSVHRVELREFVVSVFATTTPLRCMPCATLLSHGDDALQVHPQLQHCTEPSQDYCKHTC